MLQSNNGQKAFCAKKVKLVIKEKWEKSVQLLIVNQNMPVLGFMIGTRTCNLRVQGKLGMDSWTDRGIYFPNK